MYRLDKSVSSWSYCVSVLISLFLLSILFYQFKCFYLYKYLFIDIQHRGSGRTVWWLSVFNYQKRSGFEITNGRSRVCRHPWEIVLTPQRGQSVPLDQCVKDTRYSDGYTVIPCVPCSFLCVPCWHSKPALHLPRTWSEEHVSVHAQHSKSGHCSRAEVTLGGLRKKKTSP